MAYIFLVGAILCEVAATLSLKIASSGRSLYYLGVILGYASALTLLTLTLAQGLALGVAYGVWAAAGVALVAVAGKFLFHEALTWVMVSGIFLIIGGVLLVELGAGH